MQSPDITGRMAKIGAERSSVPRFTPAYDDRIPLDPAASDPQWPDRWPLRSHLQLALWTPHRAAPAPT